MFELNKWQKLLIILYLFFVSVFSIFKMPMNDFKDVNGIAGHFHTIRSNEFLPIWELKIMPDSNSKNIVMITYGNEIDYRTYFTYLGISVAVFGFLFVLISIFRKKEV